MMESQGSNRRNRSLTIQLLQSFRQRLKGFITALANENAAMPS
jgi:hypothetical protein